MKKIRFVCVVLLICILAFAFAACKKDKDEEKTTYDVVRELMANVSYPFTITTKVIADGDTFNGIYTVTEKGGVISVSYSYEKLSTFETVNGELVAPADYKTTASGSVKIKDGKVIEINGAEANLSAEAFNVAGMVLSEENLTDINEGEGTFSAKITSFKAATGIDVSAENATVTIAYTEKKLTSLTLTYTVSSCQTEIKYVFN